jgi:glycosyltransferase involved in cell wall biosynthesis
MQQPDSLQRKTVRWLAVLPYFCEFEPSEAPRSVPDPPMITYLGRVAPNKGHEYFIEALGRFPRSVQGRMVGAFLTTWRRVSWIWPSSSGVPEWCLQGETEYRVPPKDPSAIANCGDR